MFSFRKKKLIEIDNKIDSVLEQLTISNQRHEDMISFFSKIENRLDLLEERLVDNQRTVSQSVKETEASVIAEIINLRECIKTFDEAMGTLSEKTVAEILSKIQSVVDEVNHVKDDISKSHNGSIVELCETINQLREHLQQLIMDDGTISRDRIEKATCELDNKLDILDSFLRLLLLNSVMDQIEE